MNTNIFVFTIYAFVSFVAKSLLWVGHRFIIRKEGFNEKEEKGIDTGMQKKAVKLVPELGGQITEAARNLVVN